MMELLQNDDFYHLLTVVVVAVVGKRRDQICKATGTRWSFLFVLSINTLSPFC